MSLFSANALSKSVDLDNSVDSLDALDGQTLVQELQCDTFFAIQALRAQFPVPGPALILKSQLYYVLKDRTAVDRELDQLKKANQVRLFKLLNRPDDYALQLTSEFVALALVAKEKLVTKKQGRSKVFDLFVERLLPACYDVSVTKEQLQRLLSTDDAPFTEADLTLLVNAGLLILRGIDSFWFSIPGVGPSLKGCVNGRREVIAMFKRTKWRELLLKDLEKKKLRSSELGIQFHLKDLLGQGVLESFPTTAGDLIRLVDKDAK